MVYQCNYTAINGTQIQLRCDKWCRTCAHLCTSTARTCEGVVSGATPSDFAFSRRSEMSGSGDLQRGRWHHTRLSKRVHDAEYRVTRNRNASVGNGSSKTIIIRICMYLSPFRKQNSLCAERNAQHRGVALIETRNRKI